MYPYIEFSANLIVLQNSSCHNGRCMSILSEILVYGERGEGSSDLSIATVNNYEEKNHFGDDHRVISNCPD